MKIACLLMQKNERTILELWLEHHGRKFGFNSLFVFDNGSSEQQTIDLLDKYEKLGVNVDRSFKTSADFLHKGDIIANKIRQLGESDEPFDFYFPLDADELIAADGPDGLSLSRSSIEEALAPFVGNKNVLGIVHSYDGNPTKEGLYFINSDHKKCFFYNGACVYLDLGFHHGASTLGSEVVTTNIAYIHHHHKQYPLQIYNAVQKLSPRVRSFNDRALRKHFDRREPGWHLIPALLQSREEYYGSISSRQDQKTMPQIKAALDDDGVYDRLQRAMNYDYDAVTTKVDLLPLVGHIDNAAVLDGHIHAEGWAASKDGGTAVNFKITAGAWNVEIYPSLKRPRPDVQKNFPNYDLFSGFDLVFALPPQAYRDETITIQPLDKNGNSSKPLVIKASLNPFTAKSLEGSATSTDPLCKLLKRHLPNLKIETVFDVGANVGQSVESLEAMFPGATIYCFEPAPSTFKTLSSKYHQAPNVRLHNMALGERDGSINFSDAHNSTMNREVEEGGVSVQMQTLNSYIEGSGIAKIGYLKIDTEGHDIEVLRGGVGVLGRIDLIECEVSANSYNKYHNDYHEVASFLDEQGFYLLHISDQFLEWQAGGKPVLRRFNAVFVNKKHVGPLEDVRIK